MESRRPGFRETAREAAAALRSPRGRVAAAAVAVALAAVPLTMSQGRKTAPEASTYAVRRSDVRRGVWAMGELAAASSVVVKSRLPGTDARILSIVEDGAQVAQGDVLVRLDSSGFEKDLARTATELDGAKASLQAQRQIRAAEVTRVKQTIATALSRVEAARLRLRGLEQGDGPMELRRLETEFRSASGEFERWSRYVADLKAIQGKGQEIGGELETAARKTAELEEKAGLARRQFEAYRDFVYPAKLEEARNLVADADADLGRTREAGGYAVGKAESDIEKAQAQVQALETRRSELEQVIADATIRAPGPGLVVLRENHVEGRLRKPVAGDRVYQDFPLLELPDVSRMEVRARVREIDLEMLRPAQPAEATVEAVGKTFPGEVRSVGALALRKDGEDEKYFGVTVVLAASDPALRPGMTTRLFLVTEVRRGVLAVPREFVQLRGKDRLCRVGPPGTTPRERVVGAGLEGNLLTEIRSGLRENDVVHAWR